MRRIFTLLVALLTFVTVQAQVGSHSITIDEASFAPESGLAIDKIGKDTSQRPCARIKMRINRMTSTEIDQLKVMAVGGNVVVMKQYVATEGNGLIIELTAKQPTRFYLHHDKYGDSNEVSLTLEGDKEYKLSAQLNIVHSIAVSSNIKDAEVYIDDIYQGCIDDSFTLTVKDVTPGIHKLKVKSGVSFAEQKIEVNEDNIYFRIDLNTETSKPQYVIFEVTPKEATVVIEQKSYVPDAEGYVELRLYNGSYNYQVSAYGYHQESDSFIVNGSKVEKVVKLKPAHGWVHIESASKLQDANIYIDGEYVGKAPLKSGKLASGKHNIKIVKNLYEPYEDTIIIKDNETLKFNPTLTANFATVTVNAAKGAEIYINNKYKGTTSWTGDLETGIYIFEARKANHETTSLSQEIKAQPQKQSITLDAPKAIMGSIDITSSPTKASVHIDSKYVGDTPLMTDIIVGPHKVTVGKKGYVSQTSEVNIKKGETKSITLNLQEDVEPGYIGISSYPSNAEVYIDGDYIGRTPISSYAVERGKHTVKVTKSGYSSMTEEVTLKGGESKTIYPSLKESLGKKTKRAVSNAFDSVVDGVGDACDAVVDTVEDVVDTITDLDGFNIGPSIGFGFDLAALDYSGYYDNYYDGYYGGGYYDYYYSAKNSKTRSSSDDSEGEVGGEFSLGLTWRLWSYDSLINVTSGFQYTLNSDRTFLSIPAIVNINLYMYDIDCSMYFGVGPDFAFVYDDNNPNYDTGSSYQGMQCPITLQYGIGDRHNDFCCYLKFYSETENHDFGAYMGLRYSYLF